ncbi:MAG: serine hydrolase [Phaeodactylibacter sp.]|nr:serine hydrolase [Phaeodactylibacter sp.]MCB9263489.1 serine hydrolase [Lewinellaceae bacterium]MCB9291419.1 serine hydrolase [Lewinellaceae bacterium]
MYKKAFLFIVAAIVIFFLASLLSQQRSLARPFSGINPTLAKPLRALADKELQSALSQQVAKNARWQALINQKKMAVGLVDMRDPSRIKFAHINGNRMMYAASLPKIAILLAAMDAMEKGELEETEEVLHDLRIMISKSDNYASTRMIDRLGYKKIESVLTDPRYKLYDRNYGGGLWVGKRYAKQGARNPDPMLGLSHAATAAQVCRFYYLMAMKELVSPQRSEQMMKIMEGPELHHKFVNTLDRIAPEARLFRKSGSWRTYHSDSVMVWGPERRYILVALIEDPEGESICRQLVFSVEEALKKVTPFR